MIFAIHQLELASYTCVLPCPETPSCLPLHPTPLGCPSTVFGWPACHIEFAPVIYFTYGLKRPWCWERLRVGGEGDDRGWDGWMASPTQWTWVWVDCRSWWWTGRPGMLWIMGSQRVRHDWVTELNWMYIFQWCFLKSSHLCLLLLSPKGPKVCSLYQCLLCCPACRMVGTIFLNPIYIS